jgi:hypothetical protein
MLQIAEGVSYLHSKNLVYCDLKPTRLMTCQCSRRSSKRLALALQKYLVLPVFRRLHCKHFSKPICFMNNCQKKLNLAAHLPIDAAYLPTEQESIHSTCMQHQHDWNRPSWNYSLTSEKQKLTSTHLRRMQDTRPLHTFIYFPISQRQQPGFQP